MADAKIGETGDLLASTLIQSQEFWSANPVWYAEIQAIITALPNVPEEIAGAVSKFRAVSQPST